MTLVLFIHSTLLAVMPAVGILYYSWFLYYFLWETLIFVPKSCNSFMYSFMVNAQLGKKISHLEVDKVNQNNFIFIPVCVLTEVAQWLIHVRKQK